MSWYEKKYRISVNKHNAKFQIKHARRTNNGVSLLLVRNGKKRGTRGKLQSNKTRRLQLQFQFQNNIQLRVRTER